MAELVDSQLVDNQKAKNTGNDPMLNNPIPSMYGIYAHIWLIFMVNVGKYTIHGSYGNGKLTQSFVFDDISGLETPNWRVLCCSMLCSKSHIFLGSAAIHSGWPIQ